MTLLVTKLKVKYPTGGGASSDVKTDTIACTVCKKGHQLKCKFIYVFLLIIDGNNEPF
jgi:hypothetical protein